MGVKSMGFKPTKPDYSGDGVAIWNATDKNGKQYLKVKILGTSNVNFIVQWGRDTPILSSNSFYYSPHSQSK